MQKVEPMKILTIDGVPHLVDQMSKNVQALVEMADGWRVKEAEARDTLQMTQAALRDIFREITAVIQRERDEAARKAQPAPAPAPVPAPTPEEAANEQV